MVYLILDGHSTFADSFTNQVKRDAPFELLAPTNGWLNSANSKFSGPFLTRLPLPLILQE